MEQSNTHKEIKELLNNYLPPKKNKIISIRLDLITYKKLNELCSHFETTPSDMIRHLISNQLEIYGNKKNKE